jgi:hypothetical protein
MAFIVEMETMTTMTPPTLYTIIRFTLVNRRRRGETQPCWLEKVSFADGPGMKVKKMTTTRDRSKAARLSLANAHVIAEQFSQYPAFLERPDGTPMPEETAKLQANQRTRHAEVLRVNAELTRQFNEAFNDIAPLVRKAIE